MKSIIWTKCRAFRFSRITCFAACGGEVGRDCEDTSRSGRRASRPPAPPAFPASRGNRKALALRPNSAQIAPNGDVWTCCIRAESVGNLRDHNYDFGATWRSAKADELRRSIKAGECYCPLANASYTNMLCHVPTLTSVALEVGRGTATATLSANSPGRSAKLRTLPVINAADEARMLNGNGNGNGHKADTEMEAKV